MTGESSGPMTPNITSEVLISLLADLFAYYLSQQPS